MFFFFLSFFLCGLKTLCEVQLLTVTLRLIEQRRKIESLSKIILIEAKTVIKLIESHGAISKTTDLIK